MDIFLIIINFFTTMYATYLEVSFQLLGIFLPNEYILFTISILTNFLFMGYSGSYLFGSFVETFKHKGMIFIMLVISFVWTATAGSEKLFLNGDLINTGGLTFIVSLAGMFILFSLNGRINIVASGIQRSKE